MEPILENNNTCDLSSQSFLTNAFSKLSVDMKINFDSEEDNALVENAISECYDKTFLLIETKKLQEDDLTINNRFVELLKFCNQKYNFKKIGIIFIGFCDYFNLDYNKTFNSMHEKLQFLIKNNARSICGKSVYDKEQKALVKKSGTEGVVSLFDLIK